jgi:hypothetical protein
MADLNLLTVCTDAYPIVYAEILIKKLRSVSKLNINYYCLTDRPEEIADWATALTPPIKTHGWWNKLNLFSPEMPKGWNLYMDIDIVIQQNFDEEILWAIEQNRSMACVADAIGWMGVKFSSSMMVFKTGSQNQIFDTFKTQHTALADRPGGDQVWVGPQLTDVLYLDEAFPNLKKNLKFDLATRNGNNIDLPLTIPDTVKLVDCGGKPKPHELNMLPYIVDNWHNV